MISVLDIKLISGPQERADVDAGVQLAHGDSGGGRRHSLLRQRRHERQGQAAGGGELLDSLG